MPQPFPRPGTSQPAQPAPPPATTPPGRPAPAPAPSVPANTPAPTEATLGVPLYPGAQFLASYDAGRGQRFYIFGSNAPFIDMVTYYRSVLKQRGELVLRRPCHS